MRAAKDTRYVVYRPLATTTLVGRMMKVGAVVGEYIHGIRASGVLAKNRLPLDRAEVVREATAREVALGMAL